MKNHIICAYKIKNFFVNACIIMLLAIVGVVAFLGSEDSVSVSTTKTAIYNGNKDNSVVSLMINVYWGTEYIGKMLDVLKEENVKATFFLGGMWVLDNKDLITRMVAEGHELANHGYKHKDQATLNYEQSKKEIETTDKLVKDLTGQQMSLFAPPSGSYNTQTLSVAEELGYKTIMWSKDTIDWRDHDATLIYNRATCKISNGDLILMHPTQSTLEALPNIIKTIQEKGFSLKTVTENLK